MRVQETIHHGNYRNVRVVDLPDTEHDTLGRMVRACPYPVHPVLGYLGLALDSGGSYAQGWVTWEVVK